MASSDARPINVDGRMRDGCAADRLDEETSSWKPISDELKQLDELTAGISGSSGSARVMSTH